jgi:hypothetical protein
MPVRLYHENGKYFFRYGNKPNHKYYFDPNSAKSIIEMYKKAKKQEKAINISRFKN